MKPGRSLDGLSYIAADLESLWNEDVAVVPAQRGATTSGTAAEFLLVPSQRKPRLVVQVGPGAATAEAFRRSSDAAGAAARLSRVALSAFARTGVAGLVFRDRMAIVPTGEVARSLIDTLADVVGSDVTIAMGVGAVRANRKPVLQVIDRDGRTRAFAKLAVSPLAQQLLRAEAANLGVVRRARLQSITVPSVLHFGRWGERHHLLVLSAMETPLLHPPAGRKRVVTAMRELSTGFGLRGEALGTSEWWRDVTATVDPDTDPALADAFRSLCAAAENRYGDRLLQLGAWHGDWGPWNMSTTRHGLAVWDWERFAVGVPLGLDVLHFTLQPLRYDAPAEPRAISRKARTVLTAFGLAEANVEVTLLSYLLTVCARYLHDLPTEHGAGLRRQVDYLMALSSELLATGRVDTTAASGGGPA